MQNDEIKEILNNLKNKDNDIKGINFLKYQDLTRGEIDLLLDYITNLEDTLIDKQECIDAYNEIINNRDKKITNLQEENKYLNNELNNMTDYAKDLQQENERLKEQVNENKVIVEYAIKPSFTTRKLKDYKSRCEKAIEYINKNLTLISILDGKKFYGLNDYKFSYQDLLNILQNGSDDNE